MESHIFFLSSILTISFFLTTLPKSLCQPDEQWGCQHSFNCGSLRDLYYPFWSGNQQPPDCRSDGFELNCQKDQFPSIQVGSQNFSVLNIDQNTYTMTMVRTGLVYNDCSSNFTSTSLDTQNNLFRYGPNVKNFTLFYDCPSGLSIGRNNFTCLTQTNRHFYYLDSDDPSLQLADFHKCGRRINVPISRDFTPGPEHDLADLKRTLDHGFEVLYAEDGGTSCMKCKNSEGTCGMDDNYHFFCHCLDGDHLADCSDSHLISSIIVAEKASVKWHRKVIVGVTGGALLICMTICCCGIKSLIKKKTELWKTTRVDKDIQAFVRNHGPLALTRYKFSDVKKMTKSFQVKLGQGGYGVVYKGELLSGCPVAVKVLTASKGSGDEFINEVASISRTSHVNVVTLLGFCLEGRKKALIYEFMPNGSLEKFIYNKADETALSLTSEKLHQIAIGIARGLEYLHRGCNTRILHFDIKPHNILLDENFCPKISDFGLAKLCPRKESIISLSEARGTIGYLAPEVWNRNIGGVSHKSDVYSYGMMLLDMVGGRNNMNAKANDSSEIYFPDWIYNKLEEGGDLGHDGAITAEENDIAKRMTMVALWCIQTLPTHRPTISRVIEMLEGSLDSLEMPPKPVMSSPTRSAAKSSTTTS